MDTDERLPPRFWAKVTPVPSKRFPGNPCWIWTARKLPTGYGRCWTGVKDDYCHRWTYEVYVGPIPKGLEIDHVCRVRSCCNPTHLEAKTHRENIMAQYSTATPKAHAEHRRCKGWPKCHGCREWAA